MHDNPKSCASTWEMKYPSLSKSRETQERKNSYLRRILQHAITALLPSRRTNPRGSTADGKSLETRHVWSHTPANLLKYVLVDFQRCQRISLMHVAISRLVRKTISIPMRVNHIRRLHSWKRIYGYYTSRRAVCPNNAPGQPRRRRINNASFYMYHEIMLEASGLQATMSSGEERASTMPKVAFLNSLCVLK